MILKVRRAPRGTRHHWRLGGARAPTTWTRVKRSDTRGLLPRRLSVRRRHPDDGPASTSRIGSRTSMLILDQSIAMTFLATSESSGCAPPL